MPRPSQTIHVERVQTGVRLEKRTLKVLKALADLKEITLGDLIEGIVLHAFEGKAPFGEETLEQVRALKKVFNLDLDASSSHRLRDDSEAE
ncbi:MAG TPA: hypothetical protein VGF40_20445 [Thermoanaerobaculia bacterium]